MVSLVNDAMAAYQKTRMAETGKAFLAQDPQAASTMAQIGSAVILRVMHVAQLVLGVFFAGKHFASTLLSAVDAFSTGNHKAAADSLAQGLVKLGNDLMIFTVNLAGVIFPDLANRRVTDLNTSVNGETKAAAV